MSWTSTWSVYDNDRNHQGRRVLTSKSNAKIFSEFCVAVGPISLLQFTLIFNAYSNYLLYSGVGS